MAPWFGSSAKAKPSVRTTKARQEFDLLTQKDGHSWLMVVGHSGSGETDLSASVWKKADVFGNLNLHQR